MDLFLVFSPQRIFAKAFKPPLFVREVFCDLVFAETDFILITISRQDVVGGIDRGGHLFAALGLLVGAGIGMPLFYQVSVAVPYLISGYLFRQAKYCSCPGDFFIFIHFHSHSGLCAADYHEGPLVMAIFNGFCAAYF